MELQIVSVHTLAATVVKTVKISRILTAVFGAVAIPPVVALGKASAVGIERAALVDAVLRMKVACAKWVPTTAFRRAVTLWVEVAAFRRPMAVAEGVQRTALPVAVAFWVQRAALRRVAVAVGVVRAATAAFAWQACAVRIEGTARFPVTVERHFRW